MRILVVKKGSNTLGQLLAEGPSERLAAWQRLNPHVDLAKVRPGAVLVVPDAEPAPPAGSKADRTRAPAEDALEDLGSAAKEALGGLARLGTRNAERAKADEGALGAALANRSVQAAAGRDPGLRQQLDEALKAASATTARQASQAQALDGLQRDAFSELEELVKRVS